MTHTIFIAFGAILIASNLLHTSSADVSRDDVAMKTVSTTLNQFASDFYKAISEEHSENLICSPVSISMVLSMAAFGARGETAKEMRSALHLADDDEVTKRGFAYITDAFGKVTKVNLTLANKIFIGSNFIVESAFHDVTTDFFKSVTENLNFRNAEESSATINKWCSGQTNGLIKELIKPDDLDGAAMVLVNAVFFQGKWKNKFSKAIPASFHVDQNTIQNVSMMHATGKYFYGTLPNAQFIELPYGHEDKNDAVSMYIILPKTVGGLKEIVNDFHNINFEELDYLADARDIELALPKFKIQSKLDLQGTLEKMGMKLMFSNANFTGISPRTLLKISKVLQKAVLEVDEEGSKATALTAAEFGTRMAKQLDVIKFTVDKPFAYAVVHKSTYTVLFQGHITRPVY